jgi:hypothetical protein
MADRRGDLAGRGLALDDHGPEQDMAGEAVAQAVHDVADDGAGGRGDDADHRGQVGDRLLALLVEQAFGGQRLAARLKQGHQRADAGRLDVFDDELVARTTGIGRQPPGGDHLQALFGPVGQAADRGLPADAVEDGVFLLHGEVHVARPGLGHPADLAAHANPVEGALDRAFDRAGELGNGEFWQVARGVCVHGP